MRSGSKLRIAVIGAGPAGAAAGWHLATRGCAVALVDAALFPRDKTCGDWLTPLALAELAVLGLDRTTLAQAAPGHATITATRLSRTELPHEHSCERCAGRLHSAAGSRCARP